MAQQPNNTVIVYPNDTSYLSVESLFNVRFKIVLEGSQTSHGLTIIDDLVYNRAGSRCQIHTNEDQTLLVLNGSLQIYMGGYQFCAPAGSTVYIPRNVTQSQRNLGTKPVHMLLLYTPSGVETYLHRIIPLISQQTVNKTQILEIAAASGVLLCPEIQWQDLGCAFNDSVHFSLSIYLIFLTLALLF